MKIYTRTGDSGETSLFGSGRVHKDHIRIQAIGTVDELNSIIGVCRAQIREIQKKEQLKSVSKLDYVLHKIQNELFTVGADLATTDLQARKTIPKVDQKNIDFVEQVIDVFSADLPKLSQFILPGISLLASQLHHARAVCRRAERIMISLERRDDLNFKIRVYLNRLSDGLFILARWINKEQGCDEYLWEK